MFANQEIRSKRVSRDRSPAMSSTPYTQPSPEAGFRVWFLLTASLLWYAILVHQSAGDSAPALLSVGWVGLNVVGLIAFWQSARRQKALPNHWDQILAVVWLSSCLIAALSPQPQTTWWVAGVHALAVGWWCSQPLWRVLALIGGFSGMGFPPAPLTAIFEYGARGLTLLAGFACLYRHRSAQPQTASTVHAEPVPLDDLPHPRYLSQRLSLYLQKHLAALQAEGMVLYLYDLQAGALEVMLKLGSIPDLVKQRARVMRGDGCVGVCAVAARPIAFLSLLKPPQDVREKVTWEGMPTLCIPMFDPDSPSGRALGVLQLFGAHLNQSHLDPAQQVAARIAEAIVSVRHREAEKIANFQRLSAIVAQVEDQSPHTRGHSHRVAAIADLLAEELGLENELREKLRTAALFHDIGKTRVPPEVLNKEDALTDVEKVEVRRYPLYSTEICANMGFDEDTLFLIRYHGERLDGSGYPAGLDASKQPFALRILAVADVFDTMACTRSYRGSLSMEERLKEMAKLAGSKLDVLVVETLRRACLQGRLDKIYRDRSYEQPMLKVA